MKKIELAKDLKLPVKAITETFAVLGKRGSGKTYTSKVMVEGMLDTGLPVVISDPVGAWWGLRSSADGRGKGYPITIFGGEHGDLPLRDTDGELIAEIIVKERISAILDLSLLRKAAQVRFMTAFAEYLYHENRDPLHLVLDEADAFAPQRPQKGAERCLGAINDIIRRGRIRGLGATLITQRSAVLSKDVLTQTEVLVAMRTTAPHDRDAIKAWVNDQGTTEEGKAVLDSLSSLPIGTAWFWSPGWLKILKKVQVKKCKTFDSSATPEVGQNLKPPKKLATIDLEKLKERMVKTIEESKANDPKELKKEIVKLMQECENLRRLKLIAESNHKIELKKVKVPVLQPSQLSKIEKLIDRAGKVSLSLQKGLQEFSEVFLSLQQTSKECPAPAVKKVTTKEPVESVRTAQEVDTDDVQLGKCEKAVLSVLAQHSEGRNKPQLAILSGYSAKSGSFNNSFGKLRSSGCIFGGKDNMQITETGLIVLGDYDPLPEGLDLLNHWLDSKLLGKCEREVLKALAKLGKDIISTKEEVAEQTGYSPISGSFNNALGKLRTLELIKGGREDLRASEVFFA